MQPIPPADFRQGDFLFYLAPIHLERRIFGMGDPEKSEITHLQLPADGVY